MALQSSGPISLNEIHIEAGGTSGTICTINDSDIRGLISKDSGVQMSFNEWYGAGVDMEGFYALTEDQKYWTGSVYAPGQVYKQSASAPVFPEMGATDASNVGDFFAFGYVIAASFAGANRLTSYNLEDNNLNTLTNLSGSPVTASVSEVRAADANRTALGYSAQNDIVADTTGFLNYFSEVFTVFNVANSSKSSYTTLTDHLFSSGTTASISNVSKHDVFILYCYARSSFSTISETSSLLNVSPDDDEAFFDKNSNNDENVCAALVYATADGTLSFSSTATFSTTNFFYVFQIS